jgi:hypothetical protein
MSVNVLSMSTDYTTNVTEVKLEITENLGRISRVRDTLTVTIAGRHDGVTDDLMELVFNELEANGLDPFPAT